MNKPLLIGLIAAGGLLAFVVYKYMLNPSQAYSPTSANPNSNPTSVNTQGGYPFQASVPPRVDNSNQPWANNNRAALNGVSTLGVDVNLSNSKMLADILNSGSSIIDSGQSIWSDVSSWFGSGDDSFVSDDWTFNDDYGSDNQWSWA